MEQDSFKMIGFLLRVVLLLQLTYSINHLIGANASQPEVYERLSKIEAHNRQQEIEISLLKTQAIGDRKEIHQLRDRVAHLEASTLSSIISDTTIWRQKRPVRLLPARLFMSKKDPEDDSTEKIFYGPPTSCEELRKLGYTLNGYYLVKGKDSLNSGRIRAVYCQFKEPPSTKGKGLLETMIGIVDVKTSLVQFNVIREGSSPANRGQKLDFPKPPTLNVGNGFDWPNQLFRAPYSGTYFFSLSGTKDSRIQTNNTNLETRVVISFLVNGESIGEAISSEKTQYGGFSLQVVRKLNATDKIELIMKFGRIYNVYFNGWMLDEDLAM